MGNKKEASNLSRHSDDPKIKEFWRRREAFEATDSYKRLFEGNLERYWEWLESYNKEEEGEEEEEKK